jgi:hypothetical protein
MSDIHARPDPYDMVFGVEAIDDRLFPPIAEEAGARGLPLADPDRFLFLTSVGHLLQAIAGPPEAQEEDEAVAGGSGETMKQHGRLLFHAFHFWRAGKRVAELEAERLRRVLDRDSVAGDWTLAAPAEAGYLRLPRNLVWAAPAPGSRPEPADGFFWTLVQPATDADDTDASGTAAAPALHLLMALGVRADRPGFSVVTASGVTDAEPHWADVDARPGGRDFHTTLPGGELDRLYSVETTAELLKLASLCFRDLDVGE